MKKWDKDPYLLEKRCLNMFQVAGWDTSYNMTVEISKNHHFRPDITLSYDNNIWGYVETSILLDNDHRSVLRFIERTDFIINKFNPTVFILTNGYIFELYLDGEYFDQISYIPSPEDIKLLLKSKKEEM